MIHKADFEDGGRVTDANQSPPSATGPHLPEAVPPGRSGRAVVVKAGNSRLHLRVFRMLAPEREDDRGQL
ncbi:MAG: hypothetical protein DI589_11325 [Shinella sp.]|nr:MAG: hypothetical protein DI589_11325 [Shinella sp.]